MFEARPVAAEELRHALAQRVGHTARAFAEIAEDVALREVARRTEDQDRLLLAELMRHEPREPCVRPFGHAGGVRCHIGNLGVIVDLEVFGFDDAPAQPIVLDLILPEILGMKR